jgi:predicted amidophosphoribosyltransferase
VQNTFKSLSNLLFPQTCIGCEKLGSNLCRDCAIQIHTPALLTTRINLLVFAGTRFSPLASQLILAAKEDNNRAAREILANSATRALGYAMRKLLINSEGSNLVLVPIPSRNSINRSRGFLHTMALAKLIVASSQMPTIQILNCLEHSRKVTDQSTLNNQERLRNMAGAIIVKDHVRIPIPDRTKVFLLDDLVTTGSTANAAKTALEARGIGVLGVIASCAS